MIAVWAAVLLRRRLGRSLGRGTPVRTAQEITQAMGVLRRGGGLLLGLAAASPEMGINVTSAARDVSDIGLGAMLGSTVLVIPVIVTTAYLATRKGALEGADKEHKKHRRDHYVAVDKALTVQALPYLAILAVFALLTLPAPWRGLQPIDGWLLLIAYLAYLLQALVRGREKGRGGRVESQRRNGWP